MKFLRIVGWDNFQHYKDRNPQWIKLHNSLLSSPLWWEAGESQKALIIVVMLMASRHNNCIPAKPEFIQDIGHLKAKPNLDWLVDQGFCEYTELEERRESPWPSRYVPDEVREQVLERDGHKCLDCGATENLEIDHIVPVSKGGTGVLENLQTLCIKCNRKKRTRVRDATTNENLRSNRYAEADVGSDLRSLEKRREENINPEEKREKAARPTIEEISEYCVERKNQVDPAKWLDYYSANGWRVGRNPMKDWKAAVRTWERNGFGGKFNDGHKTPAQLRDERRSEAIARGFGAAGTSGGIG